MRGGGGFGNFGIFSMRKEIRCEARKRTSSEWGGRGLMLKPYGLDEQAHPTPAGWARVGGEARKRTSSGWGGRGLMVKPYGVRPAYRTAGPLS